MSKCAGGKAGLYALAVGMLSAAVLSYEIVLTRVLAITQWHHFAHAIISLALLGFGASGTALSLLRRRCERSFHTWFFGATLAFGVTVISSFWLSQRLPLNPFMLLWDKWEWAHLALYYVTLSVPFFFGAFAIGLALIHFRHTVATIYAADLIGASIGAIGTIGLLYLLPPVEAIACIAGLGILTSLIVSLVERSWLILPTLLVGSGLILGLAPRLSLNISPYKELSVALEFPDTEVLDTQSSPLGLLHLLDSPAFHHAPGLSFAHVDNLPRQRGIFVDAGGMSPIVEFSGDWPTYLDNMTASVVYSLVETPRVLVLGAGGGSDVLAALAHNARQVDAVELNQQVIDWVRADPQFSGGIYDSTRYPVRVFGREARGFVEASREPYDLIQLTLLDSVSASSAGVYALSESYLYTREAMQAYQRRLSPGGILAITRWIKRPPRDSLRLFATAAEVCGEQAAGQLAMIRSWRTATLLVKNGNYTHEDTAHLREFCQQRSFDLVYLPDIREEEVNRYHQLEEPVYYQACQQLLSPQREAFIQEYPFQIMPATDERPYFFHFFRWKSFDTLRKRAGNAWFPVEEWGYLVLIATLAQATVLSLLLIIVPLFALPRRGANLWIFIYFVMLGGGFMFIEIASIQRFILFLSYPTYAVAVVLCGFLLFAGLGSFLASRWQWVHHHLPHMVGIIALVGLLYTMTLGPLFRELMGLGDGWKIVISLLLLAPLATCMGMPFPVGLQRVANHTPLGMPWAWAINGCASVVSAVLATFAAMAIGFTGVLLLALGFYLIAASIFCKI